MTRRLPILALSALAATAPGVALAVPATAAETASAVLLCDDGTTATVTGFGRETPLKVTGSTSNYVVKYAESNGTVLLDLDITGNKTAVTCTTTSPYSGTAFTFRGFFTPAGV